MDSQWACMFYLNTFGLLQANAGSVNGVGHASIYSPPNFCTLDLVIRISSWDWTPFLTDILLWDWQCIVIDAYDINNVASDVCDVSVQVLWLICHFFFLNSFWAQEFIKVPWRWCPFNGFLNGSRVGSLFCSLPSTSVEPLVFLEGSRPHLNFLTVFN